MSRPLLNHIYECQLKAFTFNWLLEIRPNDLRVILCLYTRLETDGSLSALFSYLA